MQLTKDLANTLGMPGEQNENILINRCGFNSKGFLSRLYLNGLDIKGCIDLSDGTGYSQQPAAAGSQDQLSEPPGFRS